jgi:hypothetical protein
MTFFSMILHFAANVEENFMKIVWTIVIQHINCTITAPFTVFFVAETVKKIFFSEELGSKVGMIKKDNFKTKGIFF